MSMMASHPGIKTRARASVTLQARLEQDVPETQISILQMASAIANARLIHLTAAYIQLSIRHLALAFVQAKHLIVYLVTVSPDGTLGAASASVTLPQRL